VTEDDDLDRQRESHDSIITVRIRRTKVHVEGLDDVFGTDSLDRASMS
jgi:hypothetical protein